MKEKIFTGIIAVLFVLSGPVYSFAESTTTTAALSQQVQALLDTIKNLQAQIQALQTLQEQVAKARGEISQTIQLTLQLRRGMTGEEVTTLQEILTADPSLYPEGLVTGFFGPLTENAVRRFQKKFGIEQVGEVGPKTRVALHNFLGTISTSTANLPPGLAKKLNISQASTAFPITSGATITICHIPPGNPAARHTITIGASAWFAHSKHGDTIGACDGSSGTVPTTTPDTIAPVISGVSTLNLKATTTDIVWTTDELSNSQVWFGTTTPLVLASSTSVSSSALVTSHGLSLSGLATSTTYYYVVASSDASGNTATSSQSSFATLAE